MLTKKRYPAQLTNGSVQMKCYRSFREAEFLREDWDVLVERIGGDFFSSFDWCAIWWKHYGHGRRLEIYVGMVNDELVAVLPVFRETLRWGPFSLRVIRMVGSGYFVTRSNLVIEPQRIRQVTSALMRGLDSKGGWDLFNIGNLPESFQHGKIFTDALRHCEQTGRIVFNQQSYTNMIFDIPETFEKYLEKLSRKERRNVRRDERQLEQLGSVIYNQLADKSGFQSAFSNFIKLHQQYWLKRGRLGHFGEWLNVEKFHRELAQVLLDRGRLVFVRVLANGQLQAVEYGARFGRCVHWIIGGRSREITSRIGFCALVRAAVQMGVTQIDASTGYYDYKRRLGARVVNLKMITVFSPSKISYARFQLFKGMTWLICLVYFRIWFWRVAPWLRRKMPGLQMPLLYAGRWWRFVHAHFLVEGDIAH